MNLSDMKIAWGRTLICICNSSAPLNMAELRAAIAKQYEKEHNDTTLEEAVCYLQGNGLIDNELAPTERGKQAYLTLVANGAQDQWAWKFFRKSNSPNIGQTTAPNPSMVASAHHRPNPGLGVVR